VRCGDDPQVALLVRVTALPVRLRDLKPELRAITVLTSILAATVLFAFSGCAALLLLWAPASAEL
jgi:hypothetical protein